MHVSRKININMTDLYIYIMQLCNGRAVINESGTKSKSKSNESTTYATRVLNAGAIL
jgi:hypothetical protein